MFLVKDERHGMTYLVFTWEDPRKDGYTGNIIEGVSLDYDMEYVHNWPQGSDRPEPCVGQDTHDPKHYKVSKHSSERQAAGYQPVVGEPVVFGSWSDYLRLNPDVKRLERLEEEKWYERLDEYDEASRRRRKHAKEPPLPPADNRDAVAAWVAKKHLIVDGSIREVWYLPRGAPAQEIRLLELSDRLAGPDSKAEAIDFGLDIDGVGFHLLVADVTSEQLDQIKQDPSRLPPGWSLDGRAIWRRGA